jgi:phasin family protein
MANADDKPKIAKPAVKAPAARVAKPKAAPKPVAKPEPAPPAATVASAAKAPVAAARIETPAVAPAVTEKTIEAVTTATQTAAAAVAPVIQKDIQTMENTIKTVTEKTQAAFAEFNDRAKTAVEKSTKMFEDANEFGKGNVEALVESSKIAAKGFETLGQDAAAYAKKSFEDSSAALKSFAGAKSPTDFFKLHSDFVRGAFDSAVAESAKSTEAFLKLASEIAQPLSNRFAVAAEKAKIAA